MIDFYTAETANGYHVELMLEEPGLSYSKHLISLSSGDHHKPEFLKLNHSGRIPAIVDHQTEDIKKVVITQSVQCFYIWQKKLDVAHRATLCCT